jgi:hypothetical protein
LALPLEFVNVIVRKPAVERNFPGGLDGFARQELSNLAEDEHLLRVGFMSGSDAYNFVDELETAGLRFVEAAPESDIAVVVDSSSPAPPWLSLGHVDGYHACWGSGHPPGKIVWPEPGFLLRCPSAVCESLAEIVGQCGAELQDVKTREAVAGLSRMRCVRGEAEIVIEAIGVPPVGLWGQRQLWRRKRYHVDVALISDLELALVQAGASR